MQMRYGSGLMALATSLAAFAAQAQDQTNSVPQATSGFDDIVVTARRREENLQNVPVAVTALSGAAIERQNLVRVEDLQRVTPGLAVATSIRGSSTPQYTIRGQRTFDAGTSVDPAVTVYFDEYGVTRNTGSNQSLFDLQSIQVLKGPQGTLFGRNTTGGAILIVPNAPTKEFDGYLKGTVGSYDLRDLEGVINLPVTDTLAIRIAGKHTRRDGYFTNVLTGQKLNDMNASSARIAIAWEPVEGVRSTTIGMYFDNDSAGSAVKFDRIYPQALAGGPLAGFIPAYVAELAATNALGDYQFRSNLRYVSKDRVYGLQNKTEIEVTDNLTVKNIIGYRKIHDIYSTDSDGSSLPLIDFVGDIRSRQFSNELQLLGDFDNLKLIGGLFYFTERSRDYSPSFQFGGVRPTIGEFRVRNKSYAAFGGFTLDLPGLVEGLSVNGGLRYTKDDRFVTPQTRTPLAGSTNYRCQITGAILTDPQDASLCGTELKATFKEPTYDIGLNYQIAGDTLVYTSFRHGYKAGGINPRTSLAAAFLPYEPETVDSFEVGLKTDFQVGGMSGRFNVAGYAQKLKNNQKNRNVIVPNTSPVVTTSVITNAAVGKLKGGELEFQLRPTEGLDFSLGYSYIDAKYTSWTDTIIVAGSPVIVDISDSAFAYVPKHQLNASLRAVVPISEEAGEFALQGNVSYQSSMYTQDTNTSNCGPGGVYLQCLNHDSKLKGYATANLRFEWNGIMGSKVDMAVFVDNVTNAYYESFAYPLAPSGGFLSVGVGAPRMYGLSLRAPFGASAN